MRIFNKSGDVSHYEAIKPHIYNTHDSFPSRKRIIGHTRSRRRDRPEQSRFAYVGQANDPHISQDLQLQFHLCIHASLAMLRYARCLIVCPSEPCITSTTKTPPGYDNTLPDDIQIRNEDPLPSEAHFRADRHTYYNISSPTPVPTRPFAMLPLLCSIHPPSP